MKNVTFIARRKIHAGDLVYKILVTVGIALFSLSFLFVLVWMVMNSVRPQKAYFKKPYEFWNLKNATFENYLTIFKTKYGKSKTTMPGMMKNSLVLIVVCTGLQSVVPVITSYVLARYKTKLGTVALNLVIVSMVVPAIGATASTYAFMTATKLKNTWAGIFIMNAGGLGFGTLLYKNYFASISWEYAESAFLDGAGNLKVFFRIMYPQALPLIVSMGILNVIGLWNDYMTPYFYLYDKPTVALGVYNIQQIAEQRDALPQAFAAMTFMTVFVLIIYGSFSKTIMTSMSVGGLKG